jgi:hypothetical protein
MARPPKANQLPSDLPSEGVLPGRSAGKHHTNKDFQVTAMECVTAKAGYEKIPCPPCSMMNLG